MQGKEVFKHAVTRMKEAAEKVIERAGLQRVLVEELGEDAGGHFGPTL